MKRQGQSLALAALLCVTASVAGADIYVTEGTNISIDVAADGRASIDLLGGIWMLPASGGEATALVSAPGTAKRPRWSPAGDAIVFEASAATHNELRVYHLEKQEVVVLGEGRYFDQHPDWHPSGDRIVFSSARSSLETGFDLWEIDVATGLSWRLTNQQGDELEPAWSADGRNLLYINRDADSWTLMLRRFGQADRELLRSSEPLAAPSWRPDGSLVTYMQRSADGWQVRMIILSEPLLDRLLIEDDDLFVAPLAWPDRQSILYTANGQIRRRPFNSWTSRNLPFRAAIRDREKVEQKAPPQRRIAPPDDVRGTTVVRAGRLFDGLGNRYQERMDIVITDGLIAAVEPQRERPGTIVVDLGDVTVVPGFVDAHAKLSAATPASMGPLLLSLGLTTLVTDAAGAEQLNARWSGKDLPGPRVFSDPALALEDKPAVRASRPSASPRGRYYADIRLTHAEQAVDMLSGLADAGTPNLDEVFRSRPAGLLPASPALARRFAEPPNLRPMATTMVMASASNQLYPGVALHAEFRALSAAGLTAEQALKAAGVNAAAAIGASLKLGRIANGAAADLVLIDGDPLNDIGDAINIVAIVRNGRFYSVSGLFDRAAAASQAETVE